MKTFVCRLVDLFYTTLYSHSISFSHWDIIALISWKSLFHKNKTKQNKNTIVFLFVQYHLKSDKWIIHLWHNFWNESLYYTFLKMFHWNETSSFLFWRQEQISSESTKHLRVTLGKWRRAPSFYSLETSQCTLLMRANYWTTESVRCYIGGN